MYELAAYQPKFRDEILEFQHLLWGEDDECNSKYLAWKYEQNPYLESPRIYLALHQGRVVGMRGFFGVCWEYGSPPNRLPCLAAGDLLVAPKHRRRGLFRQISQAALRDLEGTEYKYLVNFSARPTTFLGSISMGWRSPGPFRTLRWESRKGKYGRFARKIAIKIPVIKRYTGNRLFPMFPPLPDPFCHFDHAAAKMCANSKGVISVKKKPRPEAMATLIGRLPDDERLRHRRNKKFFAWRFDNPRSHYRFVFWDDENLRGYLILQSRYVMGRAEAAIVDWEADDQKVREGLLKNILQYGGVDSLRIWTASLSEETLSFLHRSGFCSVDQSIGDLGYAKGPLLYPIQESNLEYGWLLGDLRLLDISNWHLQMIFSDEY